ANVIPGSGSFDDVKAANINFGNVGPSPSLYRFTAISTCEFFAANGPWNVHVYTTYGTNADSTAKVLRNIQGTTTNWMSMKFWQPNFGPQNWYNTNTNPPVMLANCWTNMKWVVDQSQPDAAIAASVSFDESPVKFSLAVDAMGAATGTYSAPVYFELITP
ncbi:MAG: hypothetical protein V2A34_10825, partial [Lentisphaerota bacterium]